jgi:hypothetical protein
MSQRPLKIYSLVVILSLLCAFSTLAKPRYVRHLPTGIWGGQHIRIDVAGKTASIEYDCANGTITGPLTINSRGEFKWRGAHSRERPGPVRFEQPNQNPAVYSGWVKGGAMSLTVRLADTGEELGTFTLSRGSSGRVFKCR